MIYFRDKFLVEGDSVIDIGSMIVSGGCYKGLFYPKYPYIGMDIEPGPNVDIVGYENIKGVYDAVISGQVMEHVKRPWEWLRNLTQYTNSLICIIAPNTWREHKCPLDTYRYYPDGMRDLFEYANINEIEIFAEGQDTIGIGRVD